MLINTGVFKIDFFPNPLSLPPLSPHTWSSVPLMTDQAVPPEPPLWDPRNVELFFSCSEVPPGPAWFRPEKTLEQLISDGYRQWVQDQKHNNNVKDEDERMDGGGGGGAVRSQHGSSGKGGRGQAQYHSKGGGYSTWSKGAGPRWTGEKGGQDSYYQGGRSYKGNYNSGGGVSHGGGKGRVNPYGGGW
jgi:hypothetical protein